MSKYRYIGFTYNNGERMPVSGGIKQGWWERKNGSEGGELHIDIKEKQVVDFDGCGQLPVYVQDELKSAGYRV